jgi:vacuolar-type H+-ATPase subunit H
MAENDRLSIFDDRWDRTETAHTDGEKDRMSATPYQPSTSGGSGTSAPSFPLERRGYDRAAVDAFVTQATAAYQQALHDATEAGRRNTELERRIADLEMAAKEQETPTYAGLGKHAATMLRLAEEQAALVTQQSREQAQRTISRANKAADAVLADARNEADERRAALLAEIEQHRGSVVGEVQQAREHAVADAEEIVAAARREADQIRLAAEQETTAAKTAAIRQAEQIRASADREVQEARRALSLERERLAKEATAYHTTATERTQRLVADAETRAAAAERRAAEAMETSTNQRQQAQADADGLLAQARQEAEQLLDSARTRAAQIVARAQHQAEEAHTLAEERIDHLRRRRDGILAQLAQLRDLVGSFASDDDSADFIPRVPWSSDDADASAAAGPHETNGSGVQETNGSSAQESNGSGALEPNGSSLTEPVTALAEEPSDEDDVEQTIVLEAVPSLDAGYVTPPASNEWTGQDSDDGRSEPLASVESEHPSVWQAGSPTASQMMFDEASDDEAVEARRSQ